MNWQIIKEPFEYVICNNLFTEEEENYMFDEILSLHRKGLFVNEKKTGAAHTPDGQILKQNNGVFLNSIYHHLDFSDVGNLSKKINENLPTDSYEFQNSFFWRKQHINWYNVLLSYYEKGDYYKPHSDQNRVTAVHWFFKEPKKFTGGDLVFSDYDISIPCQRNLTVLFPSFVNHAVTPIEMEESDMGESNGRFTMSVFYDLIDQLDVRSD